MVKVRPVVLTLECASASPCGLGKAQITGPTHRVSELVDLGWGLRICISNKFVLMWCSCGAAGSGTTLCSCFCFLIYLSIYLPIYPAAPCLICSMRDLLVAACELLVAACGI